MSRPRLEDELDTFGAFFTVVVHNGVSAPGPPWRPLGELVTEPDVLRARVRAVRAALARDSGRRTADVELRVAAATAHLGIVARLLAPLVAATAMGRERIDARIEKAWWQNRLGEPFPLAVRTAAPLPGLPPAPLAGSGVETITRAFGDVVGVPVPTLWGNVGSAANTAARLVADARADLGAVAFAAADRVLVDPRVDGGGLRSGPAFRRRSCCLIYRITGDASAVCEDCVLAG